MALHLPQRARRDAICTTCSPSSRTFSCICFPPRRGARAWTSASTWYLGALTFGTFLILVITGILLMLYYHPSVPQAYADMKDLQFVVSSGVFLRNLHRWSAHAMVFLVFAHMFKVFYRGAIGRRANLTG